MDILLLTDTDVLSVPIVWSGLNTYYKCMSTVAPNSMYLYLETPGCLGNKSSEVASPCLERHPEIMVRCALFYDTYAACVAKFVVRM